MTQIKTKAQYKWAMDKIEELLPLVDDNTPTTDKNYIELELLSNLVADYEDVHYPINTPTLSEIMQLRMFEMGLTQQKVAELLEVSQSRVSEYISGKSEPTLKVARNISKKLNIEANLVLGI